MQGIERQQLRRAVTRRTVTTPPRTRADLRLLVEDLDQGMRDDLAEAVKAGCDQRPEPAELVRGVERGRPASLDTFLTATVAVATTASPSAIRRMAHQFYARLMALRKVERANLTQSFCEELDTQCAADARQQRFADALRNGDVVEMQRCIEATAAHIFASEQYLQQMQVALRNHQAKPAFRPTLTVTTGAGAW